MELVTSSLSYERAPHFSSRKESEILLPLTVNHGLEILYLQRGTKFFNALIRTRAFVLKKRKLIHNNHKRISKADLQSEEIIYLRRLIFSNLIKEKGEWFYFRNETKLLKENLVKVNYFKDFSLNENGYDQSHYCYMNSREYKIEKKLSEDKLKSLAWSNILTSAPKGISQKILSHYLNVSNATLSHWSQLQEYHISTSQKVKLGSIKRTYKSLIRAKFAEIKYKKSGHSKVILKKSKDNLKVELWAILSNKYTERSKTKKIIKWSKNKTFKFSLIKFINENGTSRLFSNRAKLSLKKKERRSEASYSTWVKSGVKVNLDFITIKKGSNSFQKLWKYKTLVRNPIVLKNAMNELKRNDLFRVNEIISKKKVPLNKIALTNNWFHWQTLMFKPRLQKGNI